MENPIQNYWQVRLEHVKAALEGNNFEAFIAEDAEAAKRIMRAEILPQLQDIKNISRGDSLTFEATGMLEVIEKNGNSDKILELIGDWEKLRLSDSFTEEQKEWMRATNNEFSLEKIKNNRWNLFQVNAGQKNISWNYRN